MSIAIVYTSSPVEHPALQTARRGRGRGVPSAPGAGLLFDEGEHLVLKGAQLAIFAKEVGLVRGQEIDRLVPLDRGLRAEPQVLVVIGERGELEDHEPFAQAALEGEPLLGAELQAGARDEEIAELPELVRLQDDRIPVRRRRATHYSPSPGIPFTSMTSKRSEGGTSSPSGRTLAAEAIAARTSWSFSRS